MYGHLHKAGMFGPDFSSTFMVNIQTVGDRGQCFCVFGTITIERKKTTTRGSGEILLKKKKRQPQEVKYENCNPQKNKKKSHTSQYTASVH